MNQKFSTWKKYRSTKIDFTTSNKGLRGLFILSVSIGLIPLFLNSISLFSLTSDHISAIPPIIFGITSMLSLCCLGIAVLVRHYRQAKQ